MPFQEIFEFYTPTKLIFGPGALNRVPEELPGESRGLIATDSGIVEAGILEKLTSVLDSAGVSYSTFDGVEPNPPVAAIQRGYERFQDEGCGFLIGLGGGSSMDTAKMIGVLAGHGGQILDYVEAPEKVKEPIPFLICIPTTYGTASEVTPYAVVTDPDRKAKLPVIGRMILPKVGILDPELLAKLPLSVGGPTGMDALTHAIESYVSLVSNVVTETLALGAIRLISANLRQAVANDYNLEATQNMLLASTMAGLAFSQTRVGVVHAMAHPVGGFFNVPHGIANAILLPHVMEFNLIACPDRFALIAIAMGESLGGLSEMDTARGAVEAVRKLSSDVGIPRSLSEVGVEEEAIPEMAKDAMTSGNVPVNPRKTRIEDVIEIYRRAM